METKQTNEECRCINNDDGRVINHYNFYGEGMKPTIGENGNWFVGNEDTGVHAQGPVGPAGVQGAPGPRGPKGDSGGGSNPVGTVITYTGLHAPEGYLIMDGSEYNIADYQDLADHFRNELEAVNYYGGDGTTTFAVPDARGEFIRGYDPENEKDISGSERGIAKHQEPTYMPYVIADGDAFEYHHDGSVDKGTGGPNNIEKLYLSAAMKYYGYVRSVNWAAGTAANALFKFSARPTNINLLYCIKF